MTNITIGIVARDEQINDTAMQIVTKNNYFIPISALSIISIHFLVFYSLFYSIVRIYLLSFQF